MPRRKKTAAATASRATPTKFYNLTLPAERDSSPFYVEYNMLMKTVEAVNNFNSLYRTGRTGARGGPSTHAQQDLYRAMFVFACAGLDAFVKQLVKTKLPRLLSVDKAAETKFKEYVRGGLRKDDKTILNTIALALIDQTPRDVFVKEYIDGMTSGSLQSVEELRRVSDASGLNAKELFPSDRLNAIKDAFIVRNEIIHEMDLNTTASGGRRTPGYRTRRQRRAPAMEKHTKTMLNLARDLFTAYKSKFDEYKIEVPKESKS